MPTNTIPLPDPDMQLVVHGQAFKIHSIKAIHAHAAAVSAAKDAEIAGLRAELLREHADHKETIEDAAAVVRDNAALRAERVLLERGHKSALDGLRTAAVRINALEDALRGLVGAADDDSAERWESALDAARAALNQTSTTLPSSPSPRS